MEFRRTLNLSSVIRTSIGGFNMQAYLLDKQYFATEILDEYDSFLWTDRYYECGDFEYYTGATKAKFDAWKVGYILRISNSEHFMIIENRNLDDSLEDGPKIKITGQSGEAILKRRVVIQKVSYDKNTPIQTAIKDVITKNLINPADPNRKIPNFIFKDTTDPVILAMKLKKKKEFYGEEVYTVVQEMCEAYGIGFKVTLNDLNQMVFELYNGLNRSFTQTKLPYVVFSPEFNNLANTTYAYETIDKQNVVYLKSGDEDNPSGTWEDDTLDDESHTKIKRLNTDNMLRIIQVGTVTGIDRKEHLATTTPDCEYTEEEMKARGYTKPTKPEWGYWSDGTDEYGNPIKIFHEDESVSEDTKRAAEEAYEKAMDAYDRAAKKPESVIISELTKEANEKLDEVKPKANFEGEADLTHQFEYGKDYFLGDMLELINEFKMEGNVRMTEIVFAHDASGETVVPTFRSLQEEKDENEDYNKEDD
jgi:hypothetical protein